MTDITHIFGGQWRPPESNLDPPDEQLKQAMRDARLTPPDTIYLDGKLHRFNSDDKKKDKSGWYVAFGDATPAGAFGCWRTNVTQSWKADIGRPLSMAEEAARSKRIAEARAARDRELEERRGLASDSALAIWNNATWAESDHPYLRSKGIEAHGARVTGDGRLIVPLCDEVGDVSSLQYIGKDGDKQYHPGGAVKGCFWWVGEPDNDGPVYIAEGFATAATIHETTRRPCVVAYSASNLVPVTGVIRKHYDSVVLVADHDASGVGETYAEQAAAKYGARVVVPPVEGDANDYQQAGFDLASLLEPPTDTYLVQADEFAREPAPIAWLVKHWIQRHALMMMHGPPGSGKSFLMIDMALSIASNEITHWLGHKVHFGPVVYLAGEGHHGLRGRVAAWKQKHGIERLNMWLSKAGVDFNTPDGYQTVAQSMRALPEPPALVVVDTLHRFLEGDENSAKDAKTMLDACSRLMAEFGCAVILVHHTGVAEEAQHRARGSSAWRGALDIEASVIPAKGDRPIQLIQRKAKDSEEADPLWLHLQSVAIKDWLDEDGEQVTSAVPIGADPPPEKKESKLGELVKRFKRAWFASGAELDSQGRPYVTRSALLDFLISNEGMAENTAKILVKPSHENRLIGYLLNADMITPHDSGWSVKDTETISAFVIERGDD